MLKNILKPFVVLLIVLSFSNYANAVTKVWLGGTANADSWNLAGNWSPSGVPTSTDDVQIGIVTFTNQPNVSTAPPSCNTITIGNFKAVILTVNTGITLTTGAFTVKHPVGTKNDHGTTVFTTNLTGAGAISCQNFNVGDNTAAQIGAANVTQVSSQIGKLTINGDLTLVVGGTTNEISYPLFNLDNNNVTLVGQFKTTIVAAPSTMWLTPLTTYIGDGAFRANTTSNTTQLELQNITPIAATFSSAFVINFNLGIGTTSTILYDATSGPQKIYTSADNAAVSGPGFKYYNLTFSSAGTKAIDGGNLTVGKDWTTSGGAISLATNPTIAVTGAWSNTATVNMGTAGAITAASITNNNSGGVIAGNGSASAATITGAVTNNGTITTNSESFTFATLFTNGATGLYTGTTLPAAVATFSNGVSNSGTFNGGAGPINITAGTGTLTNNSGGTVAGGAGTITIGALTNSNGGNINGNGTAGILKVNGLTSNAGTITVNNETMTFTGAFTNTSTGTFAGGTLTTATTTFSGGVTNAGSFTGGVGPTAITGSLSTTAGNFTGGSGATGTTNVSGTATNTGGTITGGTGAMTFNALVNTSGNINGIASPGTGAMTVTTTSSNSGTITVNNETMTFTGAATNSGTYTGGTGTSTFSNTFGMTAGSYTGGAGVNTFTGAYTNSGGAFTAGAGDVDFNNNYTNSGSGTFTANATGNVIFGSGSAQALNDASAGTTFNKVQFSGNSTKTMSGAGGFSISGIGVLTMLGTTTSIATGGVLTLRSISGSSAIVDVIPASCTITGSVGVERFIKGGANKRGYRLITSTVYQGTDPTAGNVFDLQYLPTYVFVSGTDGAANGFNVPTTNNPSLYLFREDETPPPTSTTIFTTGYNWKGVSNLTGPGLSPAFATGTQAKGTTTNIFNSTVLLPVGNGVLFFYRGDKSTPANYTAPLGIPQDVTLKQTGTLNIGPIAVKLWYNYANGTAFTFTATSVNPLTTLQGGYTLVGNPYPATINWEKYNNPSFASGAITGTNGLPGTIYFFNPVSKQYDSYVPSTNNSNLNTEYTAGVGGGGTATGSASNFITSGQGFFIIATATGQTLSFGENAKVIAQPATATTLALMGTPKELAAAPVPLLRLKMVKDSDNNDEIVIRLNNNANAKYVAGEDAMDLDGDGALETLSTFSSDNVRLAIDFRPFPGKQDVVIPLKTGSPVSGAFQLNMTQLSDLPALYMVWLKDAFTGDSVQMKAGTSYAFNIDKTDSATFGANRFRLVIRQDAANAYQLVDFTGSRVGNSSHVQLVWDTKNEQNYINFTVERSTDGGNTFDVVGGLPGTGAGKYSLVDKNALTGANFYRLKQEDNNNIITYSNTIDVLITGHGNDANVNIYPNPAAQLINLDLTAKGKDKKSSYNIIVTNSSGFVVRQATSSQTTWQNNVSDLQPGTYLVQVLDKKDNSLIGQTKFVKL